MKNLNSFLPGLALIVVLSSVGCTQEQSVVFSAQELSRQIQTDQAPLILDVRTVEEFSEAHIPGAVNIPHTELAERITEINEFKNQRVIVHCHSGRRADLAQVVLEEKGFTQVLMLDGHFLQWQADGFPLQSP
ncbi:MAG: rhodanese-like domain-containing protein [Gammaproteobacteria bacterium]